MSSFFHNVIIFQTCVHVFFPLNMKHYCNILFLELNESLFNFQKEGASQEMEEGRQKKYISLGWWQMLKLFVGKLFPAYIT